VAQILADHGWKNVHPLYGGFDAWVKAGLPVEEKGRDEPAAEDEGSDGNH
jgi:3-mercaptopyruvate sulfurtransferase SseA